MIMSLLNRLTLCILLITVMLKSYSKAAVEEKNTEPVHGICPEDMGMSICFFNRGFPCDTDLNCTKGQKCCLTSCDRSVCQEVDIIKDDIPRPQECWLQKNPGDCQSKKQMYYYNPVTKDCISFVYTGCGGNQNRFATQEECQKKCKVTPEPKAPKPKNETTVHKKSLSNPKTQNSVKAKLKTSEIKNGWKLYSKKFVPKEKPVKLALSKVWNLDIDVLRKVKKNIKPETPKHSKEICDLRNEKDCVNKKRLGYYWHETTSSCWLFIYEGCRETEDILTTNETCVETCKDDMGT